jgi:biotin synthase
MFRSFLAVRPIPLSRSLATHGTSPRPPNTAVTRHTWAKREIQQIYDTPLLDLVFNAATVHRQHHDPSKVQLCTLMNIKSASIPIYPFSLIELENSRRMF